MALAIPTVISQLITTIYNLADTFWVGQLNDPNQLAALAIIFPAQMVMTAIGNLFGIGAGTVISRHLGAKDLEQARRTSAFGFYGGAAVGLLCLVAITIFRTPFLRFIGATDVLMPYLEDYLFWVFTIGGLPTVCNLLIANMIRGEGFSRQASFGLSMGGILNIILDPFFVLPFGLNMEVRGAAIATMLSNCATTVYFVCLLYRRGDTVICLRPDAFRPTRSMVSSVLLTGLPSALQVLLSAVSNMVLNNLIIFYGEVAEAAMGLAKKIDTLPMGILMGLSQGAVPLFAYNYGAKNEQRMRHAVKTTLLSCLTVSAVFLVILQLWANPVTDVFIKDAQTIEYGAAFIRLHCLAMPFMSITFVLMGFFQATANNRQATALSVIRKGAVDIPLMFLMNMVIPMYGVIACQPITDTISASCAAVMYLLWYRKNVDQSAEKLG